MNGPANVLADFTTAVEAYYAAAAKAAPLRAAAEARYNEDATAAMDRLAADLTSALGPVQAAHRRLYQAATAAGLGMPGDIPVSPAVFMANGTADDIVSRLAAKRATRIPTARPRTA